MGKLTISELRVMKSAAGFYVGRSCQDSDMPGFDQPYSRESTYFPTAELAKEYLGYMQISNELEQVGKEYENSRTG